MTVVTISRQFGSGGSDVGYAVAQAINARCVDRALIVEAARRIGVPEDIVSGMDERIGDLTKRFIEDISLAFGGHKSSAPQSARTAQQPVSDLMLLHVTRSIIENVAEQGNAVIVGRGAQVILRGHKDAVHIRLVAPLATRVDNICQRMNVSQAEAKLLIERQDRERAGYMRRYYNADWTDPLLYHMVLNTGLLGIDATVQLIVLRAGMLHAGKRPAAVALPADVDAQRLLSSLQAAQESAHSVVARYRRRT